MMGGQRHRSIGLHIGRGAVTALDPATGKSIHQPVGAADDSSEFARALETLYQDLGQPAGHLQVAFSDDLLLFAAWPLSELPRKRSELARLARWRLAKIAGNGDDYEPGYQAVKTAEGHRLLVCGVPERLLGSIRQFVQGKALRWTVADSTASFVFNHLKPELKESPGGLLLLQSHWTFLSWDEAGAVGLVKPGTSPGVQGSGAEEAVAEVSRLLLAAGEGDGAGLAQRVVVWSVHGEPVALPERAATRFQQVNDVLRPGIQTHTTFDRLAAELASYTR